MKKRLISFALAIVLCCSTILSLFPAAAEASALGDKELFSKLKAISYTSKIYNSPEEKLATMTLAVENERYSLFIQEFTAEICVVDKITGQMLFSNPYDVGDISASSGVKYELLSQIKLSYRGTDGSNGNLTSYYHGAQEEQINIKLIRNGVRVEYTIGDPVKKRIVPHQIEKSRFEENILKPFFEATTNSGYTFEQYYEMKKSKDAAQQAQATAAESFDYGKFIAYYTLLDLNDPNLTPREQSSMLTGYPITSEMAIYLLDEEIKSQDLAILEGYIRDNTKYSLEDMLTDHDKVGYEAEDSSPAIFKMALEYTLEEDGFQVRLPARGISFDAATYTLETIQVLPFLGAGRTAIAETDIRDDEGYNFIPDGSGAIISFDQNTVTTNTYGMLYGRDFGFYESGSAGVASEQIWRYPVYGTVMTSNMKIAKEVLNENGEPVLDEEGNAVTTTEEKSVTQGYVAFITEGESLTQINAVSGGQTHPYHSIGTTFFARQTDSYPLDGITVSGGVAVYTKAIERKYVGNYVIKYRMLKDEEASYVGMAKKYREYLEKNDVLKKLTDKGDDISLYLDFIGNIDTTKKVLGVPVDAKADLTTFEEAKTIFNELKEAGVAKQVLRYLGWANGGLTASAPAKIKVEKELGGEEALRDLISHVQGAGGQVYMDLDFSYVNKIAMFDGFDEETETAKTIDGKTAYYQTYNPIVQSYNTEVAYVISSAAVSGLYSKITEKYAALFGEGKKTISVGSLGSALNSSQDEETPLNREDAKEYNQSALEKISKDYSSVLVQNGNSYTWKYTDTILEIPLDSSNRITTTAEVPFLGILLHGYMNYTGEAINLAGDYEYTLLKTIENGANPYFVVAYKNVSELKVNGYSEYYAVEYATWKESIIEEYKKLNEALGDLQEVCIKDHQILGDRIVKVIYENGTEIYLNYNNFETTYGEVTIGAMGFAVVKA